MRIRAIKVGPGWHPSQVMVSVKVADGHAEFVSVDHRSWDGKAIMVSPKVATRTEDQAMLVELPRESESGAWRIWISPEEVAPDAEAA
jgi:hypothetical protein